jgi:hypothetical protein
MKADKLGSKLGLSILRPTAADQKQETKDKGKGGKFLPKRHKITVHK